MAPVCEAAALAPASVLPDLRATIAFFFETSLAILRNFLPAFISST